MAKVFLRWALPLTALFVLGPGASRLIVLLQASDGTRDVSVLVNTTPALGVLVLIGVLLIALVGGAPAAKLFGPKAALATVGFTLAWAAWYTTPLSELARRESPGSLLITLAVEGALTAVLGGALLWVVINLGRHARDPSDHLIGEGGMELRRCLTSRVGLVAILVGAVAAAAVSWGVAIEPQRGQSLFAAFLAGIAAGCAGIWGGSFVDQDIPRAAPLLSMLLVAIVAPIVGVFVPGGEHLRDAVVRDSIPGPVRLQGIDWLVGAALGVPIGIAWVRSAIPAGDEPRRTPARA